MPPRVGYMEARQGTEDSRQREDGRYIQSWLSITATSWETRPPHCVPEKGQKSFHAPQLLSIHLPAIPLAQILKLADMAAEGGHMQ